MRNVGVFRCSRRRELAGLLHSADDERSGFTRGAQLVGRAVEVAQRKLSERIEGGRVCRASLLRVLLRVGGCFAGCSGVLRGVT